MVIKEIKDNRKKFIDLLLLADEQESMIDKYINSGQMFALYNDDLKSICIVVHKNFNTCELKNIATYSEYQKKGYGKHLINFICEYYKNKYSKIIVGTGDSPLTIPFYVNCGFKKSYIVKDFFIDNYNEPIIECGVQLVDMIYLSKNL